jgi:DNA-binding transcriptional ArsR family regulator
MEVGVPTTPRPDGATTVPGGPPVRVGSVSPGAGGVVASTSDRLRADGWEVLDEDRLDGEPEDFEITSAEQLRVLTHALRLRLMTSLARRPASAKELAARFDVPTTRLYHHLDLLEEHGFIEVVATRRSGARTERCYGVPPRRNIRPAAALSSAEDRDALADSMAALVEVVGAGLAEAVRLGRIRLDEDDRRTMVSSTSLRLTPDQQRHFAQEYLDLLDRVFEAATETNDAEEAGEDLGAEPIQLLVVLAPDVLLPE